MKKAEDERKDKLAEQKNALAQPQPEIEVTREEMGAEKKEEPQGSPSTDSKLDDIYAGFGK